MTIERDPTLTHDGFDGPPSRNDSGAHAADRPDKKERDWKRTVLIAGLGALSWVATYVGMMELIEANMGDLPIIHRIIIGFSVAMLMIMIVWLLDQMFRPHPFITRLFYASGYVFLSLISVGFGFGFYWKVLESRGEASRSAESAVAQVQGSLHAASTRLEQLQATLIQLTTISTEKAEIERSKGTSCPNSKPGDGPRRKMREEDAQRFAFSADFVKGRVAAVKGDMGALDGDLAKIVTSDASTIDAKSGNRNEFMRALSRKLDMTVTGFNAFRTDPQLRQIRTDLADRAEKSSFGDGRGKMVECPDAQLQTALRGVVKAIDQLPELEKPTIAAVEGSEATIEAFRRLTASFYGLLSFKLPPSSDELRELQKKAVQSVESPQPQAQAWSSEQSGLSKRDYVPLAVAVFVDLCLFLVSMVQRPHSRLSTLLPKMRAAERGPVIQILSRFNEIHRDSEIRENFELFRHVVFDMNGDYYVAVPLDAPPRLNPQEREALRVEAQLLGNLFASFEKEKIFKRTMLPMTSSVQRRLARQGSKFAGSTAFRVYKFADGAWSDIILGAIMGAARRVEQDPARAGTAAAKAASAEAAMTARIAKALSPDGMVTDAPRARTQPLDRTPVATPEMPAFAGAAPSSEWPPMRARPAATATATREALPDPQQEARFGPYARAYAAATGPSAHTGHATAPQAPRVPRSPPPPHPEADVRVRAAMPAMPVAAVDATQNAPTTPAQSERPRSLSNILHLQRPQTQSDGNAFPRTPGLIGSVMAARIQRSDDGVEPLSQRLAKIERGLERSPAEPRIDVTLSRETATYSVPASAAAIPQALKTLVESTATETAAPAIADRAIAPAFETDRVMRDTPAITAARQGVEEIETIEDDEPVRDIHDSELTAAELAFIGRMAPPAAE
ncbi:MAG: hypothetical protein ACRCS9_09445 [Hyphomicrobium sp.]